MFGAFCFGEDACGMIPTQNGNHSKTNEGSYRLNGGLNADLADTPAYFGAPISPKTTSSISPSNHTNDKKATEAAKAVNDEKDSQRKMATFAHAFKNLSREEREEFLTELQKTGWKIK